VIDSRLIAFAGLALALGHFVHAGASALGLSLLLRTSDVAFTVMKVAGAAYLAYLGVRSFVAAWRGRTRTFDVVDGEEAEVSSALVAPRRSRRFLLDGFLCNVLNPKVALFYLALLPRFIAPGESVLGRSLLLAGAHGCISVSWQSVLSLALGRIRPLLSRPAVYRTLEALTGSLLVGFGVRLALATR